MVVGVEVAAGLGDEEDADEGDEEHEVAAEREEEADAGLGDAFVGTAMPAEGGCSSCRYRLRRCRRCACRSAADVHCCRR